MAAPRAWPFQHIAVRILDEIEEYLSRDLAKRAPRIAVILGEPGSGRSTLLARVEPRLFTSRGYTGSVFTVDDIDQEPVRLDPADPSDVVCTAAAPVDLPDYPAERIRVWRLAAESPTDRAEALALASGGLRPPTEILRAPGIFGSPQRVLALGQLALDRGWEWILDEAGDLSNLARFVELMHGGKVALPEPEQARQIPAYAADDPRIGTDVLGIRDDAQALAALIAAKSVRPPLSIGIFGEWGSGKSFLMRRIEGEVKDLSAGGDAAYCSNVVHVWFNAWHYTEGNLWASLVDYLFDELKQATTEGGTDPIADLRRQLDEERKRIAGAQAEVAAAKAESRRVGKVAAARKSDLEARLTESHEQSRRSVWSDVKADPAVREEVNQIRRQLGLDEVAGGAKAFYDAAGDMTSTLRRGRLLLRPLPESRQSAAISVAVAVGTLLVVAGLRAVNVEAFAGLGELSVLLTGGATWLGRQAKRLDELLGPVEQARARIEQRYEQRVEEHQHEMARLDAAVEAARLAYTTAESRLVDAQAREAAITKEIEDLSGARLLARFVGERADSGDYRKMLGTLGLVRRDFERLADHLAGGGAGAIERIVLYIDDLDRCQPERVVQVLEAVHLLLAFELFVVVVGVDPRWLRDSLREKKLTVGASVDPWDYLEKIFQLAYWVQPMTAEGCTKLLTGLASEVAVVGGQEEEQEATPNVAPVENVQRQAADHEERMHQRAVALELTPAELELLAAVGPLVGRSPRTAKRFINLYRVVKARFATDAADERTTRARITLLALTTGLQRGAPVLMGLLDAAPPGTRLPTLLAKLPADLPEAERRSVDQLKASEEFSRIRTVTVGELRTARDAVARYSWLGVQSSSNGSAEGSRKASLSR